MKTALNLILLFFGICGYTQTTITGTVKDNNGQPIPGANIIILNTTVGAISDFDGSFTLKTKQACSRSS